VVASNPILWVGFSLKTYTEVIKLLIYYDVMNSSLKVIAVQWLFNAKPFNVIHDIVMNIFSCWSKKRYQE
jgi:hypothetical protein